MAAKGRREYCHRLFRKIKHRSISKAVAFGCVIAAAAKQKSASYTARHAMAQ